MTEQKRGRGRPPKKDGEIKQYQPIGIYKSDHEKLVKKIEVMQKNSGPQKITIAGVISKMIEEL